MKGKLKDLNQLPLDAGSIQYVPGHTCPRCHAPAIATSDGAWIKPYQDWYTTSLSQWLPNLGYVAFWCDCELLPETMPGSMRVAVLGDAILPLPFDDGTLASHLGLKPSAVNADRIAQAVAFLSAHADPQRTCGNDPLLHIVYAVSAGNISPDLARYRLEMLIQERIVASKETASPSILAVSHLVSSNS